MHIPTKREGVELVRVSLGSAIVLSLERGALRAKPTTIYLMTYKEGKCTANCSFCPQSRSSLSDANLLSRVIWPPFPLEMVKRGIESRAKDVGIKRICIQTVNYRGVLTDTLYIVRKLRSVSDIPISVSIHPLSVEAMRKLINAGVERVGIPLDAATEEIFERIKGSLVNGPYRWRRHREALEKAAKIFGKGRVSTHFIVGLGESEKEMVEAIQWCVDRGITPALFAFTPIRGTKLEGLQQPSIESYRRVQIARYLIVNGIIRSEDLDFDEEGNIRSFPMPSSRLLEILESGDPLFTSGCPGCNRPFYNERVSGPLYNIPSRELWLKVKNQELKRIRSMLTF